MGHQSRSVDVVWIWMEGPVPLRPYHQDPSFILPFLSQVFFNISNILTRYFFHDLDEILFINVPAKFT